MTHDERISSYIDNELSAEQEQEFLISLAASDGLRKSFRSELVLKKVLHHDEAATNPPRNLRPAIFATLGLGLGVNALSANKASAAQPIARGLVRSLFATKLSTLVTIVGVSGSALVGYGVRSLTTPAPAIMAPSVIPAANLSPSVSTAAQPIVVSPPGVTSAPVVQNLHPANHLRVSTHSRPGHAIASKKEAVSGAAGGGPIEMVPPTINGRR